MIKSKAAIVVIFVFLVLFGTALYFLVRTNHYLSIREKSNKITNELQSIERPHALRELINKYPYNNTSSSGVLDVSSVNNRAFLIGFITKIENSGENSITLKIYNQDFLITTDQDTRYTQASQTNKSFESYKSLDKIDIKVGDKVAVITEFTQSRMKATEIQKMVD